MTEIHTLTDLAAYAQEQVERLARMQEDLAVCAGEGESPGGLVSARNGSGASPEVRRWRVLSSSR